MQELFKALTAFVVSLTEAIQAYAEARKEQAKLQTRMLKNFNRALDVVEPILNVVITEAEKMVKNPEKQDELKPYVKKFLVRAANKMDDVFADNDENKDETNSCPMCKPEKPCIIHDKGFLDPTKR